MLNVGTRCLVMHNKAKKTSGGLTKDDLTYNKHGKIVSVKMSENAKKENRLEKAGWKTEKGKFGSFQINGGGIYNTPPGTPEKSIQTTRTKAILSTGSKKKALELLDDAINKAIRNGLLPVNLKETSRENQNPNNAIFIDEIENKVYKIGLWDGRERCIKNECIAYDILKNTDSDGENIHYPELYSWTIIKGTKFGMITLEYIPNIKMIKIHKSKNMNNSNNENMNNTNNSVLINEAITYLEQKGINHNDISQNLFKHKYQNKDTFLWIDFEAATFDKTKPYVDEIIKIYSNNNNNNSNNNSNNNNSNNNNSSPKKKIKFQISNNNNSNNNKK